MENKSIKKNMLMNVILTLSNFVFPLITFSYISRVLTPVGTGKVAFVTSFLSYFSYFSSLGIPIYGLREAAKIRDDKKKLSQLVFELLIINAISMFVSCLLLAICTLSVNKLFDYRMLILIMSTSILFTAIGMEWLYNALEEYSYITIRSLIFKIIYIPLTFILIKTQDDYLWYGFLSVFVASASYICNFVNIRKHVSFSNLKKPDLFKHIKPILILFSAAIIINVYANFDVVMLGFIRNEWEVGLYNTALKLKTIVLSISTATTAVLIPRITTAIDKKNFDQAKNLISLSIKTSLLFAIPLAVFTFVNGVDIVMLLFGEQYLGSVSTLKVLMVCIIPLVFTNVFGNQILIASGKEKLFTISVFVGMIINLTLNLLMIPKLGSFGAALGTLITEIWNVIFMGYFANKVVNGYGRQLRLLKFLIAIAITPIVNLIAVLMTNGLNIFMRLFISGISFFTTYYLILLLEKEELLASQVNKFLKRIRFTKKTKMN